ncbi:PQQ-binding-like beta-propeller repeat protein [Streptomyces aidingensis]|uniref:Serine/threonine protein kinase n=1 Tax=Streptomyces aidingensis TaxID=910347 RepID=A0A1I1FQA8_9ACTN|nr:serine/threonine-protein kinase [Streptomyces aidingensis]SFC01749.1 Serine/threonine protein kinase [Streptomyces aidingensis]
MPAFEALAPGDPERVGPYRITGRLGAGGMGQVYLGRSRAGRLVAVKVVRPELAAEPDFRRRFAREAAAARKVSGAFTASVIDADPEGTPAWLATAYIPGLSLADAVSVHGPWPEPSLRALGAGLAEALESIHRAGLVHRDLKPSNILLAPDGPRVIDFGISVAAEVTALTRTGTVIGTPGFMSPEHVASGQAGPAGDVFSLAAVLAYAATGAGPFGTGPAHSVNFRVVYEAPDLDAVPGGLRPLLTDCLAKDPGQRPDLSALLDRLTGPGTPAVALPDHTGPVWLPTPVATALGLPAAQPAAASSGPASQPAPATPTEPARPPSAVPGRSAVHSAPTTPAPAPGGHPAPRLPRRRSLLVLGAGAAVAAGGLTAWQIAARLGTESGNAAEVWRFRAGGSLTSSPVISRGLVHFGGPDGRFLALDAATGEQRWEFWADVREAMGSAAVTGRTLCFGDRDGMVRALQAETGEELWIFRAGEAATAAPALTATAAHGVIVIFGSGNGQVYALDGRTGSEMWRFATGGYVSSTPATYDGVVHVGSEDGRIYALDATDGTEQWRFRTEGPVYASPVVSGKVLCTGSDDGHLYALATGTGTELWRFPTGGPVRTAAAVSRGVLFAGSDDGRLYALDAATGEEQWQFGAGGRVRSSPVVEDSVVYFGSQNGTVHGLHTETGEEVWRFATGGDVVASPAVADGLLYIASADGFLYAVRMFTHSASPPS